MKFDISFVPEDLEGINEQYELACQHIANLLDNDEWKWLKSRIANEHLNWMQIFQIVADNS